MQALKPWWSSHNGETALTLYQGHVLDVLRALPAESVHCVVTSPPYWGLRDYKLEPQVWGGNPVCIHNWLDLYRKGMTGGAGDNSPITSTSPSIQAKMFKGATTSSCLKCGAWRGSLGLEPTPELYVQHLVEVFREVRRVLRRDGTLWLNMGDAYASGGRATYDEDDKAPGARGHSFRPGSGRADGVVDERGQRNRNGTPPGLKPKNLLGMPWRVAFALQADGWWLRSDIIWSKPNPMPESVTDRPTKAHEYLFLLTKAATYFYDADAIREAVSPNWEPNGGPPMPERGEHVLTEGSRGHQAQRFYDVAKGRNRRTVWEIATEPFPEAHFATFPQKLVEPCILAGTSEKGCCPECGAPWKRVVELIGGRTSGRTPERLAAAERAGRPNGASFGSGLLQEDIAEHRTTGWRPTCAHNLPPVPATVLDPFAGSGTTLLVAQRLGRNGIGIELNEDYCRMAVRRIEAEHSQQRLAFTAPGGP